LSTHTNHTKSHEVYFCTLTCYKWLPLFEEAQAYEAVYNWFSHLRKDKCFVVGYVIMPNHLHVLLYHTNENILLNRLVGEGKRFMAYAIVNSLKANNKQKLLDELAMGVQEKEKVKGKKHQVFRLSFDARLCFSEKMIEQKLDYIHNNPVTGKWMLAESVIDYPYSSALYYETGKQRLFEVVHYKALNNEEVESEIENSESPTGDSE
jgi:REP element-mobilizing transposase RayT